MSGLSFGPDPKVAKNLDALIDLQKENSKNSNRMSTIAIVISVFALLVSVIGDWEKIISILR